MSTATLPPSITHALGEDQFMVEAALKAGFVTLEHLDPACVAHRNALYNTLDSHGQDRDEAAIHAKSQIPHIPRPWLERWEPYYLWRVNHHPSVAAFLADAIRQQSWTAPLWKDLPKDKASGFPDLPCGLHGTLAQPIQDALLEKLEAHPYVEPIERALATIGSSPASPPDSKASCPSPSRTSSPPKKPREPSAKPRPSSPSARAGAPPGSVGSTRTHSPSPSPPARPTW